MESKDHNNDTTMNDKSDLEILNINKEMIRVSEYFSSEESWDEREEISQIAKTSLTNISRKKNSITEKRKPESKFKSDILHILEYAEKNNPLSLVMELCAKLKWEFPKIETFQMLEGNVNVYKTTMALRHYEGEGVGITKKISRKKSSVELIKKMVEDKTVRDSMRIYIDTKTITRDCKLKDPQTTFDDEILPKPTYRDEDLDKERVKQIITNYTKDVKTNPLSLLDSFRNKYNLPFCFTYTIKEKMHKAVLYVGGEIYGYGVDANIRVARFRAAEEAIKKLKDKYGEEALKYRAVEKRKNKLLALEEEEKKKQISMDPVVFKISFQIKTPDLIKNIKEFAEKSSIAHFNLEILLGKYERLLIPDYYDIQKMLALIFHSNKTLSIHFSNPILTGSFQYDCGSTFHPVIDVILFHELPASEIKSAVEILVSKLKLLFKEEYRDPIFKISNRKNEKDFDLNLNFEDKFFSVRFMIRDEESRNLIYYLKLHNSKICQNLLWPVTFNSLRRLIRVVRRQRKLIFVKPEILDWIIKLYYSENLVDSLIKISRKCSKNFKKNFVLSLENDSLIPEQIRVEVDELHQMEIQQIQNEFKSLLHEIKSGEYNKILNLNN